MEYKLIDQLKEDSFTTKILIAGLVSFLAFYAILSSYLSYRHYPIHRGAIAAIIGIITGLILRFASPSLYSSISKMDQTLIFLVLLPTQLFAKGYTMKKGQFLSTSRFIVLFGIVGTFLSYIGITALIYAANQLNLVRDSNDITNIRNLSIWEIILLSACFCSIDTIASEETVQEHKYPKLNSIIVGEDIFKDCVTIVLFRAILKLQNMQTPSKFIFYWYTPFQTLLNFIYLIGGSLLISILAGLATAFLFKKMRFLLNDKGVTQTTVLFLLGFALYVFSQCFNLSGVVSVLCYGVLLNRYNYFNLSELGQISSKNTFLFVSNISEGLMFLIMGIMVWEVQWQEEAPDNPITHSYLFCFIVLLILVLGRVLNIYVLAFLAKFINPAFKLRKQQVGIIFVSGLARGATPFALFTSVQFLDSTSKYAKNEGLVLKTTIIIVVMLCTIFLNSLIPRIFKKPLKALRSQSKQYLLEQLNKLQQEKEKAKNGSSQIHQLEINKIKPIIIYKYAERKQEIQQIRYQKRKAHLKEAIEELEAQIMEDAQSSEQKMKQSLISS